MGALSIILRHDGDGTVCCTDRWQLTYILFLVDTPLLFTKSTTETMPPLSRRRRRSSDVVDLTTAADRNVRHRSVVHTEIRNAE